MKHNVNLLVWHSKLVIDIRRVDITIQAWYYITPYHTGMVLGGCVDALGILYFDPIERYCRGYV